MADHKAARERCTTFLKEKTEVVDAQDLPVLDECPICLDSYVLEQSVRIKVEGCNHVFGRNCLTAILTNNPRLAKKCPLCRTEWMKAPAGSSTGAPSDPFRLGVIPRALPPISYLPNPDLRAPAAIQFFPLGSRVATARSQMPTPSAGPLRSSVQPMDRVINLIDSDNEEDVRTLLVFSLYR
jgi:hypothetical protein